jgi:predicted HicB family RNase H-like nuclease
MKYKGYSATAEFDAEAGVFFGRVIGLRDVITFQGTSVAELTQAFHDSVNDYLEFCAERGEQPEKPYSGHFVVRITPELHRAAANWADAKNVSLNRAVESILETTLGGLISGAPTDVELLPGTTRFIEVGSKKPQKAAKKAKPLKKAKGSKKL